MSDQTTLSSAETSSLKADVTTTTTPPSDAKVMRDSIDHSGRGFTSSTSSSHSHIASSFDPIDDIGSVLANLSLGSIADGNHPARDDSSFTATTPAAAPWSSSLLSELKTPDRGHGTPRSHDRGVVSPFATSPFMLDKASNDPIRTLDIHHTHSTSSSRSSGSEDANVPPAVGGHAVSSDQVSSSGARMGYAMAAPQRQSSRQSSRQEPSGFLPNDMLTLGMDYPLGGFQVNQLGNPLQSMSITDGVNQRMPTGYPQTMPINQALPMGQPVGQMPQMPQVAPVSSLLGYQNPSPFMGGYRKMPAYRKVSTNSVSSGNMSASLGGANSVPAPLQSNNRTASFSRSNVHRKHSSTIKRRGEDASRFVNASLDDFITEIYYLCKDQHGCRFLQRQLDIGGEEAATKIFNEIQLNVIELMIDPFGNYLIQKLLERVTPQQRTTLVRNASSQFVRIALDPHGTRALQKLVECVQTDEEFDIIVSSLSSYVVLLSRDLNGNHVVQQCLQRLPPESCDFIFDAACDNCVKISKHRHGCCVLQRCFDHGTAKQCERLSLKVGENCVELSTDPYGNYVVQYVLSMEENRLRSQNDPNAAAHTPDTKASIDLIVNALRSNLVKLSTHKFGSNVVEKSLRIPTLAPMLISQLLKESENSPVLLLHDAYGNYVLQTTLDVADDDSFKELSERLRPAIPDVRNTPHGRRILSKLISRGGAASTNYVATNASLARPPYRPRRQQSYGGVPMQMNLARPY